jgi:alpha-galactosidase
MTSVEYRTHMTLGGAAAAPLLAGNDLRTMSAETKSILMNREVIAIGQDPEAKLEKKVSEQGTILVAAGDLKNKSVAAGLFNRGQSPATIAVRWSDLGLQGGLGVRHLWAHKGLGKVADQFSATVPPHGVELISVRDVKLIVPGCLPVRVCGRVAGSVP